MKVWEFEDAVWNTEGIRIVVRTSANIEAKKYDYINAATETWSLSELIKKRINPLVDGEKVVAIRGNGTRANGNTTLRRLRESYIEN